MHAGHVFVIVFSDIDGYGFARSESFDKEEFDKFMSTYLSVMTRRAMKWNAMVGKSTKIAKSAKGRILFGISSMIINYLGSKE